VSRGTLNEWLKAYDYIWVGEEEDGNRILSWSEAHEEMVELLAQGKIKWKYEAPVQKF
jgi:hypothetical protein